MTTNEVRSRYLAFFKKKKHSIIPSASLVPENDPTTLFTGSGMQPLLPYLLGEKHPQGNRLANSQKCFRAEDIEEVGDNRHTTCFEMLGNWSLGAYWKEDQLTWFFEFLTDELKISKEHLWVTCFEGDKKLNLPPDNESAKIWEKLGIPKEWVGDFSNTVLCCLACNSFDNQIKLPTGTTLPGTLDEFFDLRDEIFEIRNSRIKKKHDDERRFYLSSPWEHP